jgi:hypothetical protein
MRYIVLFLVFFSSQAYSAFFAASGEVKIVRVHDISLGENNSWFKIDGFTSAGSCKISSDDGHVNIKLKDDDHGKAQFSILLSAKMSGKSVAVKVDESNVDQNGYCYARYVDLI